MTRRVLMVLLLCALMASTAPAQLSQCATATDDPTFPGDLEGERFQMLLDALETRNLTLASRFYSDHFSDEFRERLSEESYLELYQWVASTSGGFDFYGVRSYDPPRPGVTTVITRGRNYRAWWAIAFHYGDDPADGLTDLRITRARVPESVAATTITEAEFVSELTATMNRVCESGLFAGSVFVASGNDIILQHACGEADRSLHTLIDVATRLNIGSIGKTFTALAVTQLVEKGELAYDDTLSAFLDESWLPAQIADQVTIHHLLTHTSGLGDFLDMELEEAAGKQFRAVGDYRELVAADSLGFEPGTDWSFSNTGYILLGAVIESVTGQGYFEYVNENIFTPAGMSDTGFYDEDGASQSAAIGYSPSASGEMGWEENPPGHFTRGGPAGGGYSTARDLHRFTMALASGELVPGEALERMWKPHHDGEQGYGYGFMLRVSPAGYVVGHEGGFPGVEGYYDVYVQSGRTVAVLTNLSGAAWPVDARIRDLMARLE